MKKINITNCLFIDIEVANQHKELEEGTPAFESFKFTLERDGDKWDAEKVIDHYQDSFKVPEFCKIICISVCRLNREGVLGEKTYYEGTEKQIILSFYSDLISFIEKKVDIVIAQGGETYDYPLLFKRSIYNKIVPHEYFVPDIRGFYNSKVLDTKVLFGGKVSLITLCDIYGIPSPKGAIQGSSVNNYYYDVENGLGKIVEYCEKDVEALCKVFIEYNELQSIEDAMKGNEQDRLAGNDFIGDIIFGHGVDIGEIFPKVIHLNEHEREIAIEIMKALKMD